MEIEQKQWSETNNWTDVSNNDLSQQAELVLCFGGKNSISEPERFDEIKKFYPKAQVVLCSTAGEILGNKVTDESINLTAISFESTDIRVEKIQITRTEETFEAGEKILDVLKQKENLVYLLVISDGQIVNGSELVKAFGDIVNDVVVTGGLAGDGPNFKSTLVGLNETPGEGNIVVVGFYGKNLQIGHASKGGWDPFGPERLITKSKNNVLYELDDKSALDLYKKYLGDLAEELPGSALLFPLSIKLNDSSESLVRTVLSIDEENNSMLFAGDMPEGATVRMMKSDFDKLIDAASIAANTTITDFGTFEPDLAILISCAGRKLVLQSRVDEEVESVREVLGENTTITGFYSYGEISPVVRSMACELHNQTMTITTLKEVV